MMTASKLEQVGLVEEVFFLNRPFYFASPLQTVERIFLASMVYARGYWHR